MRSLDTHDLPRLDHRNLIVTAAIAGLLSAMAWFAWTATPAAAAEREPERGAVVPEGAVPVADAEPSALPVTPESAPALAVERSARPDVETLTLSAGIIRGDLSLSTSALDKIDTVTITVVEAMNRIPGKESSRTPFTTMKAIQVDKRRGTPTFAIEDVPFSVYGYTVQAWAPGLNGTELHAVVTKEHPIADVVLGITTAAPFSVLLRDQQQNPLGNVLVTLMPLGAPLGRPKLQKNTDSFGSALFETVLRGPYKVHAGPLYAQLCDPKDHEVLGDSGHKPQNLVMVVPRGNDLPVQVFGPSGAGLSDVAIEVYATETPLFRKYEAKTDYSGQFTFKHLPPGRYQVTIQAQEYSRFDRQWQVPETEAAQPLVARLVPK